MLAELLELKRKGIVNDAEGEHKFPLKKTTRYEHCDLWWSDTNEEHWLEVKTIRLHHNSDGLNKKNKGKIKNDLEKIKRLKLPYDFYHLLMIFDDKDYSTGDWRNDMYSLYQLYRAKKEDEWTYDVTSGKTIYAFLYHIKK